MTFTAKVAEAAEKFSHEITWGGLKAATKTIATRKDITYSSILVIVKHNKY